MIIVYCLLLFRYLGVCSCFNSVVNFFALLLCGVWMFAMFVAVVVVITYCRCYFVFCWLFRYLLFLVGVLLIVLHCGLLNMKRVCINYIVFGCNNVCGGVFICVWFVALFEAVLI